VNRARSAGTTAKAESISNGSIGVHQVQQSPRNEGASKPKPSRSVIEAKPNSDDGELDRKQSARRNAGPSTRMVRRVAKRSKLSRSPTGPSEFESEPEASHKQESTRRQSQLQAVPVMI